jgi:exopolysaccharide production protein ExoF
VRHIWIFFLRLTWAKRLGVFALAWAVFVTAKPNDVSSQQTDSAAVQRSENGPETGRKPGASKLQFEIGDKLKISFYERLGSEDDKWGNSGQPTKPDRSFYLHPEISGDYTIQPDGAISFPIIGDFLISSRSSQQVHAELSAAFEKAVGRRAFVNAILLERSPIYIIGPVKQPGVYKFQAGMTAFHAVALAGGFERTDNDKWAVLDALKESGNVTATISRLKHLLAQWAVIHSELTDSDVAVPDRLVDLVGPREAASLINDEKTQRAEIIRAREETERALASAVSAAQRQRDIANERVAPLQSAIQMRQSRFAGLQNLFTRGSVDKIFLLQAQSELSDVEDRAAAARNDVEKATQQFVLAKIEEARFKTKMITDLNQELSDRQREIGQLAPTLSADIGVLDALKLGDPRRESDDTLTFSIVRSTTSGSAKFTAEGTTQLSPGDLVYVRRTLEPHLERQASALGTVSQPTK